MATRPLRVHVELPGHAVDVVVPPTVTATELVPVVVDLVGGWDRLPDAPDGWLLRTAAGHTVAADTRIGDLDLVHGDTLRLVPWQAAPLEPEVDDVVAEVADDAALLPVPWSPSAVGRVWAVAVAWAGAGWVLLDRLGVGGVPRTGRPALTATALAVAAALTAAAGWRHRRDGGSTPSPTLAAVPWWCLGAALLAPVGPAAVAGSAAVGAVVGAVTSLAVTRGADRVALAVTVAGVPCAVAAGVGHLGGLSTAGTGAVLTLLGLLTLGVVPWAAAGGLGGTLGAPRRRRPVEVTALTAAVVGRLAAARAGGVLAVVLGWPWLATGGGTAAPVLAVTSATAVLVGTRGRRAGADRSVAAVTAALGALGLLVPLALLAGRHGGVGAGLTVAAVALLVARAGLAVPAAVRATALARLAVVEVLAVAAVPALLVTVVGGYGALASFARGIVG